jgi:hypothetical protein
MKTSMLQLNFRTMILLGMICTILSTRLSATGMTRGTDSLFCLKIKGRISNAHEGYSKGCKVELLNHKGVVDSVYLRDNKMRFAFRLKRNSYYAIRVTKSGYVSRLISVNTSFPDEIRDLCEFSFDTSLITEEEAMELNSDALDFPVAVIHFNEKSEMFVHNREYTENHKQELRTKQGHTSREVTLANVEE